MLRSFIVVLCLLFSIQASQAAELKVRVISRLEKCTDINKFKEDTEIIYIHSVKGQSITYGMFENDKNPKDGKAWLYYDLLYVDVPAKYEIGISLLARGKYEEAKEMFEASLNEKTPISKKTFKTTDQCKNFIDEKFLKCALGMKDYDTASTLYKKIVNNPNIHAQRRISVDYTFFLVEQGKGADAQKLAEKCLKFELPKSKLFEISIQRVLSISLQKKYSQAKNELKKIEGSMTDHHKNSEALLKEAYTTILINHEKNYKEGIRYFNKILEKDRINVSTDSFIKLAHCYENTKKYEDARWNLIQAYQVEFNNQERLKFIKEKILALNEKIPSKEGNKALEKFFNK